MTLVTDPDLIDELAGHGQSGYQVSGRTATASFRGTGGAAADGLAGTGCARAGRRTRDRARRSPPYADPAVESLSQAGLTWSTAERPPGAAETGASARRSAAPRRRQRHRLAGRPTCQPSRRCRTLVEQGTSTVVVERQGRCRSGSTRRGRYRTRSRRCHRRFGRTASRRHVHADRAPGRRGARPDRATDWRRCPNWSPQLAIRVVTSLDALALRRDHPAARPRRRAARSPSGRSSRPPSTVWSHAAAAARGHGRPFTPVDHGRLAGRVPAASCLPTATDDLHYVDADAAGAGQPVRRRRRPRRPPHQPRSATCRRRCSAAHRPRCSATRATSDAVRDRLVAVRLDRIRTAVSTSSSRRRHVHPDVEELAAAGHASINTLARTRRRCGSRSARSDGVRRLRARRPVDAAAANTPQQVRVPTHIDRTGRHRGRGHRSRRPTACSLGTTRSAAHGAQHRARHGRGRHHDRRRGRARARPAGAADPPAAPRPAAGQAAGKRPDAEHVSTATVSHDVTDGDGWSRPSLYAGGGRPFEPRTFTEADPISAVLRRRLGAARPATTPWSDDRPTSARGACGRDRPADGPAAAAARPTADAARAAPAPAVDRPTAEASRRRTAGLLANSRTMAIASLASRITGFLRSSLLVAALGVGRSATPTTSATTSRTWSTSCCSAACCPACSSRCSSTPRKTTTTTASPTPSGCCRSPRPRSAR